MLSCIINAKYRQVSRNLIIKKNIKKKNNKKEK